VEAESSRIGRLTVPMPLIRHLRASPCIEIQAGTSERLAFLLRDYAHLGDDRAALAQTLGTMRELHGQQVIDRWQAWAAEGALQPLFAELMALHYDPQYLRSQARNFQQWAQRQSVQASSLSEAGIVDLARQVLKNMH